MIDQDPAAGAELMRDDEVTIVVSSGAGSVIVPDVVGPVRGLGELQPLRARGLAVDVVEQETEIRARTAACSSRRPRRAAGCAAETR